MGVRAQVRAGAGRYRAVIALPEARWPLAASVAGSMPIGMYGLGILLLVRGANGSFGVAGRVVAAFGLANALGAVVQGRLMDRFGQPRVLRRVAVVHVAMLVALVVAATRGAPSWALAVLALLAGGSLPQVPAAMRSLWSALVEDEASRQTAYALVTIVFEVSVVTAPVLVAAIAAVASPSVAVLAGAGIAGTGGAGFAATAASQRWRGAAHAAGPLAPCMPPACGRCSPCCSHSARRSACSRSPCRPMPPDAGRPRRAASTSPRYRPAASAAGSSTARGAGPERSSSGSRRCCSGSRGGGCW